MLPWADHHWYLMIFPVYFISEKCYFSLRVMHFHHMEEYTGGKEPIMLWKACEVPFIFHALDHYHCHLEDVFDLAKHRWFLFGPTLDPTYSFIIAFAILLSLAESVPPRPQAVSSLRTQAVPYLFSVSSKQHNSDIPQALCVAKWINGWENS